MPYENELIKAVQSNDEKGVLNALLKGADVNAVDTYHSVLDIAIQNNNPKITKLLFEKGQNKIYQSSLEKGLFKTFQNSNRKEVAQIIATHMEDASVGSQYNPTFILGTIQLNWPEVLETLIKKNASLEDRDNLGEDVLYYAVGENKPECVKVLCKYIDDIDRYRNREKNALQLAAFYDYDKVFEVLLDAGACLNSTNSSLLDGIKILAMFSTAFLYQPKLSNQNTAMHYAAKSGSTKVLKLIAKKCPDLFYINELGTDNKSALTQAVEHGEYQTAKLLLEYGADPNVMDDIGTPLHAAVREQQYEIINLLFEYGADQRLTGPCKKTPLEYAKYCHENHCYNYSHFIEKLEYYWKKGASISSKKPFYRFPKGGRGPRE